MSNINDFVIKNGELKKYNGNQTDIVVPDGVIKIGKDVFRQNNELISIKLPEGVQRICQDAFWMCEKLETINMPGVQQIDKFAFYGCENLSEINMPSVQRIDVSAFGHCAFASINIPSDVKTISEGAFSGCKNLVSVTLPNKLMSIGDNAFQFCESLTSIIIPDSVNFIGKAAFMGCKSLKSVKLPDSLEILREDLFSYCSSLELFSIPDSVKTIEKGVFTGCVLKNFVLPKGIKNLSGFENASLREITIPDSVESIDDNAFKDTWRLNTVKMPSDVKNIGAYAFAGCRFLSTISIPYSVEYIGAYAFAGCESLTTIIIPDNVDNVAASVFALCKNLTTISMPDKVKCIESNAFGGCEKLKEITISEGVSTIGEMAFHDCKALTKVVIPAGVSEIGARAFEGCNLVEIEILSKECIIEENALWCCKGKDIREIKVYIDGADITIKSGAFGRPKYASNMPSVIVAPNLSLSNFPRELKAAAIMGYVEKRNIYNKDVAKSYDKYISAHQNDLFTDENQKAKILSALSIKNKEPSTTNKEKAKVKKHITKSSVVELIQNNDLENLKNDLPRLKITPGGAAQLIEEAVLTRNIDTVNAVIDNFSDDTEIAMLNHSLPYAIHGAFYDIFKCLIEKMKFKIFEDTDIRDEGGDLFYQFYNHNDYQEYYDDYLNYFFKSGSGDLYQGPDRFKEWHDRVEIAPVEERIEFIKRAYEEGYLTEVQLNKLYWMALLADEIKIASAIENLNIKIDIACMRNSQRKKKLESYSDFLAQGMTVVKLNFIMKHLPVGQKIPFGADYIGREYYDVNLALAVLKYSDKKSIVDKKATVTFFINKDCVEGLDVLDKYGVFTARNISDFIEYASKQEKNDAKAWLMDCQNREFPVSAEDMEKKMQHELEDMLDPVKSVKKEWRLKKEEGSEGYTIIGYKGSRAEVVIPSRIGDERITNIGVKSMSPEYRPAQKERLDQITSITLSEGIERIEEYAFFGLKHLREVILPNSLIEIGYSAFRGCNELKELVIPPNIKKIDIYIVSQRDIDRIIYQSNDLSLMRSLFFSIYTRIYLKELVIQSKITTLKKFPDWSYCCEHIVLPESVTEIEDDALKGIEMVHAPAGSFVEQYAKLHNIPFKAV